MTEQLAAGRRRNLMLLRAGDTSLHPAFLAGSAVPRTWDIHISYYGLAGAPAAIAGEPFSWSAEGGTKFNGLSACLEKAPFSLDAYDYIAIPDDDLWCSKDDWNAAFALVREYGLAACQLSLHPSSFYAHDITLRRKGLRLRWVNMIELMVPIVRVDIFKQLMPVFALSDNAWAIDHVLAELLKGGARSLAVLDAVSVLHTRAVMSGPSYDAIRKAGTTPREVWEKFMQRHGFPRHEYRLLGAIDAQGREITNLRPIERRLIWPEILQRHRQRRGVTSIAQAEHIGMGDLTSMLPDFLRVAAHAHRQYMRRSHPSLFRLESSLYRWSGLRHVARWLTKDQTGQSAL